MLEIKVEGAKGRAANSFRPGSGALSCLDDITEGIRTKVIDRAGGICASCRLPCPSYLEPEIIRPDEPPEAGNLAAICPFCVRPLRLRATANAKSGTLIWLPQVSQAVLHHITCAVFLGNTSRQRPACTAAMTHLMAASDECRARIGFTDPGYLDDALGRLSAAARHDLLLQLCGVRLLPFPIALVDGQDVYPKLVASWRSPGGPLTGFLPSTWPDLLSKLSLGTT